VDHKLVLVIAVVAAAFIFDYINGFHDAANSIATVVSTRVLTPFQAVLWAAFFNFVAFAVFDLHVAGTIGKGIIDPNVVDMSVIIGALSGAIAWNLLTWWWGLPSSSSHALVGGLIGAEDQHHSAVHRRFPCGRLHWFGAHDGGMFVALAQNEPGQGRPMVQAVATRVGRGLQPQPRRQRRPEDHGHNRGASLLPRLPRQSLSRGPRNTQMDRLRLLSGHGSWHHDGRLAKLRPFGGFCAETGGSIAIFLATMMGIPVSTTHTITGAIVGVGSTSSPGKVRWGVAGRIVWAWIFTIPASAAISAVAYFIARALGA
jgi:PiT family inorganic phosphate transporter